MELKDYLKALNQHKTMIIGLTILVALAFWLFAVYQPVVYDASIAFNINRTAKQKTTDYQYDGYYAIQASNLFAQTIMSWLMTPSFLLEVYQQAGVEPSIDYLDKFANRFQTKKFSPQNVAVRFKERDEATAQKISQALISTIEQKAQESNKTSEGDSLFQVIGSEPVIVPYRMDAKIATAIGAVIGLMLGCFLAYLAWYFKRENQ